MSVQVDMDEVLQVRELQLEAIELIGFKGKGPEDEQKLFANLKSRKNEIANRLDENEYLVITPTGLIVASAVSNVADVPEGMIHSTIPADKYVVFRFEEKFIGDFWRHFSNPHSQASYNLNCDKIRFEIFKEELQPEGITEIYFPTNS